MRNGSLKKISLIALFCLLIVTAGGCIVIGHGCCNANAKYERTVEVSSPIAPDSVLIAETYRGSITITGADTTDCSVTAVITGHAQSDEQARQLAEQVQIKLEPSGKNLIVNIDQPDNIKCGYIGVSLDITVPRQTNIQCADSRGSINITDIKGDVRGQTSRGSLTVADTEGSLYLNSSRGSISCKNISANDVELAISRGNITVADTICNSLKLSSSRGNIDVSRSTSDTAKISSSRGNINYNQATAAKLSACSSRGTINISYAPSASPEIIADVSVSRGNIDFTIPQAFSGNVDLSVSRGSVNSDIPITITGQISKETISGTIGKGNGKLNLHSSRGSINLR